MTTAVCVVPDILMFCDTTSSVSVNETMVKSLLPPVKNTVDTWRTVSFVIKLHVKGVVCGSVLLHFEGPSSRVPDPPVDENVRILSFWQACINDDTSAPFTLALLNFHEA